LAQAATTTADIFRPRASRAMVTDSSTPAATMAAAAPTAATAAGADDEDDRRVKWGNFWFDFDDLSGGEGTSSQEGSVKNDKPCLSSAVSSQTTQEVKGREAEEGEAGGRGPPPAASPPAAASAPAGARAAEEVPLSTDADGVVRGACRACGVCEAWISERCTGIGFGSAGSTESCAVASQGQNQVLCEGCGCAYYDHEDLTSWLHEVRSYVSRFRATGVTTRRLVPHSSKLPACAKLWHPADVALHVLTLGRFNPVSSGREPDSGQISDGLNKDRPLVSVCVPTSEKRHAFHPLLYEGFRSQDYEPKELVVVDTGKRASAFLRERAQMDPRVIYRFFPVDDSREERLEASRHASQLARRDVTGKVPMAAGRGTVNEPPVAPRRCPLPANAAWSLGLKRNVACHLARGALIAHFDDDDLYAPSYLSCMCGKLLAAIQGNTKVRGPAERVGAGGIAIPAIVTLTEWHMFDFHSQVFRYMDPKKDPMVLEEWRAPMIYGYGFSYVYTRAAWDLQAFPDTETCEDDVFMENLRKTKAVVKLVDLPTNVSGLVAHSFHSDCTSGGEFNGNKRLGPMVSTPGSFMGLLPIVREVVKGLPLRNTTLEAPHFRQDGVWTAGKGRGGKGRGGKPGRMGPRTLDGKGKPAAGKGYLGRGGPVHSRSSAISVGSHDMLSHDVRMTSFVVV